MEYIASIRKALVPVVIGAVITALGYLGISEDITVGEAVTLLVTAAFVYLVPNKN